MAAVEHDKSFAKRVGVPQSVGKEFALKGKGSIKALPVRAAKKGKKK